MSEALWTGDEIARATGGRLIGGPFDVTGVDIDSRSVREGDLFVALTAERDGHAFTPAARAAGAAGALVSKPDDGPGVLVADTLRGLEAMAVAARDRAPGARRGAVTGSVGKTSVTQAIRSGLDLAGPAHGSVKSYNNHIGVPLTLARMPRATERAIFEIGMNHAHEITPLSRLVRPHAVAITNVEATHVENFADGERGVARAKAEIFAGLIEGGVAVLNADNRWFEPLRLQATRAGARVRTFGWAADADARATRFTPGAEVAAVEAVIDGVRIDWTLKQSGPHWAAMSLCALLMLQALSVDLDLGLAALSSFEPLEGRGAVRLVRAPGASFLLIDESYNASPVSVAAALAALGARDVAGRRIVALTDMLELGADAPARHAALAEAVVAAKVDLVFCAGPLMRSLWEALPTAVRGAWAPSAAEVAPALVSAMADGDAVMIKGSKASRASLLTETLAALDPGARA
jgi:UDP-N-acetylmuramoyl-tripeptide--D-alanyl-D-alanine ligase